MIDIKTKTSNWNTFDNLSKINCWIFVTEDTKSDFLMSKLSISLNGIDF